MPRLHLKFSPSHLRTLRESAGLTRTALAYHLGLTEQTVWAWEQGRTVPRPTMLGAVAVVLGCAIDELFYPVNDDDPAGRPGRRASASGRTHGRA